MGGRECMVEVFESIYDDFILYVWFLVGYGRLNFFFTEFIDFFMLLEFLIFVLVL